MTSPIAVPLIIGSKSLKKSEKSVRCLWPWVKFKFEDKIPALTLTATAASTPLTMLAAPTPADIAPTFAYVGSTIIATGTNFISGSWMHCQSGRDRQLPHCSRWELEFRGLMMSEGSEDAKGWTTQRAVPKELVGGLVSLDEIPLDTPRNFLVCDFCCPNSVPDEDQHETYHSCRRCYFNPAMPHPDTHSSFSAVEANVRRDFLTGIFFQTVAR